MWGQRLTEGVSNNLDCPVCTVTAQERDGGYWWAVCREDHRLLTKLGGQKWLGLVSTHTPCLICPQDSLQCKEKESWAQSRLITQGLADLASRWKCMLLLILPLR